MKKVLSILFASILTVSCLSGCGGSAAQPNEKEPSTTESSSTSATGDATKLTLWTFQAQHEAFYHSMTEMWNEANPEKSIDLEVLVLEDQDLNNNLQISFQSGTGAPDIVDIEINKYQNYLKGEPQLVPLNDIIEPVLDKIVPARVNIYQKDDTYYGIDFHVGAEVMYYNKEILDQAGVDPDLIITWDDFHEAGKKVLAATGIPMTTIETIDSWTVWPMMSQQGSDFFDENGEVILDNEININTMKFLQSMIKDGTAVTAPGGKHHAEEYYGFMNAGGATSIWMPMWYMGRFTDYMPDLKGKMIIRPCPSFTKDGFRSATMGGTGTSITNQSKHIDLAKEFLAYCKLSEDGNLQIWKQLGFDPIRKDVWDRPEMEEPNKFTDYFGANLFDTLIMVKNEFNDIHMTEQSPILENYFETDALLRMFSDLEDPAIVLKETSDQVRNS